MVSKNRELDDKKFSYLLIREISHQIEQVSLFLLYRTLVLYNTPTGCFSAGCNTKTESSSAVLKKSPKPQQARAGRCFNESAVELSDGRQYCITESALLRAPVVLRAFGRFKDARHSVRKFTNWSEIGMIGKYFAVFLFVDFEIRISRFSGFSKKMASKQEFGNKVLKS